MVALADDWRRGGFALYVHWPFCAAKCPYCDFNSHVVKAVDHSASQKAFITELKRAYELTGDRVLNSIFFGGGTPSLMEARTVAAVIDSATQLWIPANDIEITLEANPSSVEAQKFQDFAQAGVNRVSLGVQALNDTDLKRLGRLHDTSQALAAINTAQSRFDRVSIDLIYARQHQTAVAWEQELARAISLGLHHLSLYQLTIEPGTAFGARYAAGTLGGLVSDDIAADMYDLTQDVCNDAGLPRYEVSNHAVPGQESRHNQVYWRYGDYVGIGPGAHGRLTVNDTKWATKQPDAPNIWLNQDPRTNRTALFVAETRQELLMMGLRLVEGIDIDRILPLGLDEQIIKDLSAEGWITCANGRLKVRDQGFVVLNAILNRLLASAEAPT